MPYQGPAPKPIPADSVDVNAIQQAAVAQAISQARAMIDQAKADVLSEAEQKAADAKQAGLDAASAAQAAAVDQAKVEAQNAMKAATQNARRMADEAHAAATSDAAIAAQKTVDDAAAQNKSYIDGKLATLGLSMDDMLPAARRYADDQDTSMRSAMQEAISHAQQGAVASAANTSADLVQQSTASLQKQIVDAVNALKSSSVDPLSSQITTLQGQAYKIETRDGITVPSISLLNLSGQQDVPVTWVTPFPDANYTITKPQITTATVSLIGKMNADVKSRTKDGCVITVTSTAIVALGASSLSVLAYRKITS